MNILTREFILKRSNHKLSGDGFSIDLPANHTLGVIGGIEEGMPEVV